MDFVLLQNKLTTKFDNFQLTFCKECVVGFTKFSGKKPTLSKTFSMCTQKIVDKYMYLHLSILI